MVLKTVIDLPNVEKVSLVIYSGPVDLNYDQTLLTVVDHCYALVPIKISGISDDDVYFMVSDVKSDIICQGREITITGHFIKAERFKR